VHVKPTTKVSKSFDLLSDKIIDVHYFFTVSGIVDLQSVGYFQSYKKK